MNFHKTEDRNVTEISMPTVRASHFFQSYCSCREENRFERIFYILDNTSLTFGLKEGNYSVQF